MIVYFDSGVLVKLYVKEKHSETVINIVSREKQTVLTQLHELEIKNAMRAQLGRGLISGKECEKALAAFDEDINTNRLKRVSPNWQEVFRKAEYLSKQYTQDILCRALDINHVAIALQYSCKTFITADRRQASLAEKSGLSVRLIA
jgi:predicted nucleic acid-binding protein